PERGASSPQCLPSATALRDTASAVDSESACLGENLLSSCAGERERCRHFQGLHSTAVFAGPAKENPFVDATLYTGRAGPPGAPGGAGPEGTFEAFLWRRDDVPPSLKPAKV